MNGSNQEHPLTEINLTSLVDVSLTLVIIFMVASPFVMQSGIKVSTPSLQKAKQVEAATELKAEVYLQENGMIQLNGNPVNLAIFPDSLRTLLAASASKRVLISAEEDVLHDQVIAIMDEARQCGAQQLAIVRRK